MNSKHSFLTVLEAGKHKTVLQADTMSGENLPPYMATFSLCPLVAKVSGVLGGLFRKATNPIHESSTFRM